VSALQLDFAGAVDHVEVLDGSLVKVAITDTVVIATAAVTEPALGGAQPIRRG
jgi:hypothetical protein